MGKLALPTLYEIFLRKIKHCERLGFSPNGFFYNCTSVPSSFIDTLSLCLNSKESISNTTTEPTRLIEAGYGVAVAVILAHL